MSDSRYLVATRYLEVLQKLLGTIHIDSTLIIVERLAQAQKSNQTIFVAGNGGSAASADHWVNDLCKMTKKGNLPPIKALSLSAHTSYVTALGNDEGYERIFAGQLETFGSKGDLLVVISASGNSPNLIEAVKLAKKKGMFTVGLLGFDGGALKDMVDHSLHVETLKGSYQHAEDCHSVLCHLITTCLIAESGNS